MRKLFRPIIFSIIVIVVVCTAGFIYLTVRSHRLINPPLLNSSPSIAIGNATLTLEIAWTPAQQQQGLSDRTLLAKNVGMAFPINPPARPGFWMKDMNFPLDFLYIVQNRVVELKENVQPTPVPFPFFPAEKIDLVIEVNAGWISENHVKVGDEVVGWNLDAFSQM